MHRGWSDPSPVIFKLMNTIEAIPYKQFIGQFIQYSEPRKMSAHPDSNYLFLLENYYGQGTALMTVQGHTWWQSYVRNFISKQGYKSNILRYDKPDLKAFAGQVGEKDCMLMKYHNGKILPLKEKTPEMNERSVDMRYYSDWVKAGKVKFSAADEQTGSIFGTNGNDYILYQLGKSFRVSNRIANNWRKKEMDWWSNGLGKVSEHPLLADYIKQLPKDLRSEVKKL